MHIRQILFIILIIIILYDSKSKAQNIFDSENSKKYADNLFKNKQFALAAEEYQRVIFLTPNDYHAKLNLIKSYRLAKQYELGIQAVDTFFKANLTAIAPVYANEYVNLLLLTHNQTIANTYLNQNTSFDSLTKQNYRLKIMLLDMQWKNAYQYTQTHSQLDKKLVKLSESGNYIRYKNPYLAAGISAIIPGSGKWYCEQGKDGFISLVFIATHAYMAYRGFSKKGAKSAYGWIFAGLSFGFYTGNIYGSFTAAKRHNKLLDKELYNEVENTVFDFD